MANVRTFCLAAAVAATLAGCAGTGITIPEGCGAAWLKVVGRAGEPTVWSLGILCRPRAVPEFEGREEL